ncbi:MAG: transglutaminase family protein [Pseudomonadota bacterium]
MRLSVRHVTAYRFAAPMRYVVQRHRLLPSLSAGQHIEAWSVTVPGAVFSSVYRDAGGDRLQAMALKGPVDSFEVTVEGVAVTSDTNGILTGLKEQAPPLGYLRDTVMTAPNDAVRDLAEGVGPLQPLDRAHALSAAVREAVAYETDVTGPTTTAAEALAKGAGVCQDHAHVMIAAARHCDLPARYVTGYLHASDDDLTGEAAHAWAEIHIPGLGWVGFDPANACCPDQRYVRLGSGLDAAEAAPIRGTSFGVADEALDVAVAVAAMQQ